MAKSLRNLTPADFSESSNNNKLTFFFFFLIMSFYRSNLEKSKLPAYEAQGMASPTSMKR